MQMTNGSRHHAFFRSVNHKRRSVAGCVRPDVGHAANMIGMRMRNADRVDIPDSLPQSLLPKIKRHIHKNVFAAAFNKY
jgi:hypothetical protein